MPLRRKQTADAQTALKSATNTHVSVERVVTIRRFDSKKQIVYGEVYAPNVLDTYGEFMTAGDIELMAHRFMKLDLANVIDTNHDNVANGSYPVESFIATKHDPDFSEGAWVLGVKVPDADVWAKVENGELNGYSFQSMVKPKDVEIEYTVIRDHVGFTEDHDDHTHVYFLQVDDMGCVKGGYTDTVNGHSHKITRASVTEVSGAHSHRFFL